MLQKSGPVVEANWTVDACTKSGNQLYYSGACWLQFEHVYGIRLGSVTFTNFRCKIAT